MGIWETIIRILGAALALVMLVWFVIPISIHVLNVGNILGIILSVWLFAVSFKPLYSLLCRLCGSGFAAAAFRAVNGVFIAVMVYGVIVTGLTVLAANAKPADGAAALVLGAQVRPEGEPSSILRGRIRTAERYLEENPQSAAVLSGGQGADEPQSEASCMYRVMTEDGVDGERLYLEEESKNTTENFKYSLAVMEKNGMNGDVAVVTDGFHQLRARIIYWQQSGQGSAGAVSAPTRLDLLPTYAVREWIALPVQLLFRR